MKNTTTKGMMIALFAVIFAATITSCKKEETISPANNGNPTPAVSMKPKSIVTTQDGVSGNSRVQTYEYDSQNKLTKLVSVSRNTRDSVTVFRDGIIILRKENGVVKSKESLALNSDKSLKELSVSPSSGRRIILFPTFIAIPSSPVALTSLSDATVSLGFSYRDGNLSNLNLGSENVSYTYHNNLPFQKGINELQVESTALLYHKLVEQENMINYTFSSKLLHTVTASDAGVVRRIDTYTYIQDEHGRVTTIFLKIDFPASGSTSQRFQSTITY